jgi:DNA polymerase
MAAPSAQPATRLAEIAARAREPRSCRELLRALQLCRACPLWRNATQGVAGDGAAPAALMLIGEQPGDQEDRQGKPFVGPAGRMLDRALAAAGIERGKIYVTNAVKHFKYEPRGKRRMHMKPTRGETEACRWWLEQEIRLVQPKLLVPLGVTATISVLGRAATLKSVRGQRLKSREGIDTVATVHPSMLLRLPEEADKKRAFELFVRDLHTARDLAG